MREILRSGIIRKEAVLRNSNAYTVLMVFVDIFSSRLIKIARLATGILWLSYISTTCTEVAKTYLLSAKALCGHMV